MQVEFVTYIYEMQQAVFLITYEGVRYLLSSTSYQDRFLCPCCMFAEHHMHIMDKIGNDLEKGKVRWIFSLSVTNDEFPEIYRPLRKEFFEYFSYEELPGEIKEALPFLQKKVEEEIGSSTKAN